MSDVVFEHRVLIAVELMVAWWIMTKLVRSTWFHAALVGLAPPVVVQVVWWRDGTRPRQADAVRRLAIYGAASFGAALCYRSTRTVVSVPHCVFGLAVAAHVACVESSYAVADQDVLLAVLALWCLREFQTRSVSAALCVVPLAATALWRTYCDSAMRDHHVALLSEVGIVGWNATSVSLRGRKWMRSAAQLASTPLPNLDR